MIAKVLIQQRTYDLDLMRLNQNACWNMLVLIIDLAFSTSEMNNPKEASLTCSGFKYLVAISNEQSKLLNSFAL